MKTCWQLKGKNVKNTNVVSFVCACICIKIYVLMCSYIYIKSAVAKPGSAGDFPIRADFS